MKELFEKIKGLDKKVLVGVGIGVAVVLVFIIVLIISGGKPKPSDNDIQNSTENGTQNSTTVLGTEVLDDAEAMGTELETEVGTEIESTETGEQGGSGVTNPSGQEIIGGGNASNPYLETPNLDNMTLTTINIPAGQTVYYGIYRVGGMWLSISDADAYVIEADGTRHNASNGKVGFTVENAMANEYVVLQIGNSGSQAKSFTIKFSNIKGSYQNPEKITTVGQYTKHLSAGNEVGYYYKYVAEKKGSIRFYIVSESSKCGISVTNNRNSANRSFQAEVQEDSKGRYVELEADFVEAGDTLMIVICAEKYRGEIPAVDVTWEIVYVE